MDPQRLLLAACYGSALVVALSTYPEPPRSQPNPPAWPSSVHVFGPEDANLTDRIRELQAALTNPVTGQFSSQRLALLFKPGRFDVSIEVGYYVQVLGLGERTSDVVFEGEEGVFCLAMGSKPSPGSLDTFWRGAENFLHNGSRGMYWAVSQAAPLRRLQVERDLTLFDANAWASGGFMADMQVGGNTRLGGQQQWFTRNAKLNTPDHETMGGAWNMVFVGTEGAPSSTFPQGESQAPAYTNEPATPNIAEKPFITIGANGSYSLQVPPVRFGTVGPSMNRRLWGSSRARSIPFEQVFVARSDIHTTYDIQAALSLGQHVVFSPGIFTLTSTLSVTHAGQVLLGIGLATLAQPLNGSPCIHVASGVPGVRLAGLLFQAAANASTTTVPLSSLLEWGEEGVEDAGDVADPGVMSDLFMRVGGPEADRSVRTDVMVRLHSGNLIGDNLWLWRADHAVLAPGELPLPGERWHLTVPAEYHCGTGLEVVGNDVAMYGLFVEHTLQDLTRWKGEHGVVYFYQSELPYGVGPGNWNYSGYVVEAALTSHQAFGIGVYSYFRDHPVEVANAIRAPATSGVRFTNSFTRFLNGHLGIRHVLNEEGPADTKASRLARVASSLPWPGLERTPAPTPPPAPAPAPSPAPMMTLTTEILFIFLAAGVAVAIWEFGLRPLIGACCGKRSGKPCESSTAGEEAV